MVVAGRMSDVFTLPPSLHFSFIDITDLKSLGNESITLYLDSINKDALAPPHPVWYRAAQCAAEREGPI